MLASLDYASKNGYRRRVARSHCSLQSRSTLRLASIGRPRLGSSGLVLTLFLQWFHLLNVSRNEWLVKFAAHWDLFLVLHDYPLSCSCSGEILRKIFFCHNKITMLLMKLHQPPKTTIFKLRLAAPGSTKNKGTQEHDNNRHVASTPPVF